MVKEKVLKTVNKYNLIKPGDRIVIGVSGGPDSVCLLHILNTIKNELNFEVVVAHVNHMLREEADSETEFVQKICENMNIKCYVKKVDILKISEETKMGTEEAGRVERYKFFDEICKQANCNKIATAHNANDKVETVLLNILRGSAISRTKRN